MNGWTGAQYSLLRVLLGGVAGVHFAASLGTGGSATLRALLGLAAAALVSAGWARPLAALVVAVLWSPAGGAHFEVLGLTFPLLYLLQAAVPPAPYGSLAARGRDAASAGWRLPGWILGSARIVAVYAWVDLLCGPAQASALWRGIGTGCATLGALDPGWVRGTHPGQSDRVFYDGACGLCHRGVRFLLAEDRAGALRYAPLGGPSFLAAVSAEQRAGLPDSLVVQRPDGRLLTRAGGVLHLLARLGGAWRLAAAVGERLPRGPLDRIYALVAAQRRRLAPAPLADVNGCPLLPPELAERCDP